MDYRLHFFIKREQDILDYVLEIGLSNGLLEPSWIMDLLSLTTGRCRDRYIGWAEDLLLFKDKQFHLGDFLSDADAVSGYLPEASTMSKANALKAKRRTRTGLKA